jgi:transcriptional regulator with XRE-family HTH domain
MRYLVTSRANALRMPHLERRLLVASRMKDARVNSGLSQRDVAEALCIGASTYCRMERGKTEPSAVQLSTLSGLYGLSVLWLLGIPTFIAHSAQSSSSSSSFSP